MIIVEPPATRFELGEAAGSDQEHLLERISALENRLARTTERLERGLDLLLRQAQNSYFDRALIKALVALLSEDGIVEGARLEQLWNDRCQKDAEEQEESARREEIRAKIVAAYRGEARNHFEQFINEGFLFIEDHQVDRGIRSLQKAIEVAPENSALLSFLGQHFFQTGKTRRAYEYLTRAHELSPGDVRVSLLLGLTCADEGETERAKDLLNNATRVAPSFAAHYGLGRLFAAEENWQQAVRELKRALASKPSPEAHYALGCLYYQLIRDNLAIKHLRKATELDSDYSEAFHVLGLVYSRLGKELEAKAAFDHSAKTQPVRRSGKRKASYNSTIAPLFQGSNPPKLITGSDHRFAAVLRQDALSAFAKD